MRANSDLAVVRSFDFNQGDRLELFAVGTDNALWHVRQFGPDPWLSWESLGGAVAVNTSPTVGINQGDLAVEVFVVGTNHELYHIRQTGPNIWSGWQSLGGTLRDNTDPAVYRNIDGRLQVFVVGVPNGLYYTYQQSAGSNTWSGYNNLGGAVDPNTSPVAVRNTDGRLEVFLIGTDNALWHIAQAFEGSNTWSGYQALLCCGLRDNSDPAVISHPPPVIGDQRLQVFVVDNDGQLLTTFQNIPSSFTSWSPKESLGGVVRISTSPDSVCNEIPFSECNTIHVFVSGTDGALWHKWRTG